MYLTERTSNMEKKEAKFLLIKSAKSLISVAHASPIHYKCHLCAMDMIAVFDNNPNVIVHEYGII